MILKQWRTPAIVLGVLALLYLLTRLQDARHATPSDEVFAIESDVVGRIVLREGDKELELVRISDTLWVLTGHEHATLRQWRLDRLFDTVLKVKRESIISDNPDKWATYGVDDSSGRQMELYDIGDRLEASVVVGRSETNWQSSHLRAAGRDEVYLTGQSIYHLINADTSFWLEPPPPPPPAEEAD